jgi:transcriptional regulator with XRE-family HTH domain
MRKSLYTVQNQVLLAMLRDLRARTGTTQVDLAERVGMRQTDVSKCERGVRRLDVIELRAWLSALGISLGEFAVELDQRLEASAALDRQARGRGARRKGLRGA